MSFTDAFRVLNSLKRRRVIRDYAVIGAVAATAYMEPMFTEDIDVIIQVDTDEEYLRTFRRVAELAEGHKGMHHSLGGIPVQMFPSTTKPLYRDALEKARLFRIGGLRVKVASAEHLVLLYLEAFRQRDKLRLAHLLPAADMGNVRGLLGCFDDEKGTLALRLKEILGTGIFGEGEAAPAPGPHEPGP